WEKGEKEDGTDSYAKEIAPQNHWDLRVAAVVLNETEKDISSREGMKRTVETSKFYEGWLTGIQADIEEIKTGIKARDFNNVGTKDNCLKKNATTLGTKPPFTY